MVIVKLRDCVTMFCDSENAAKRKVALCLESTPGPVTSYDIRTGRGAGWTDGIVDVPHGEESARAGGCLALLPAARDLAAVDREITSEAGHETRLRNAIRETATIGEVPASGRDVFSYAPGSGTGPSFHQCNGRAGAGAF